MFLAVSVAYDLHEQQLDGEPLEDAGDGEQVHFVVGRQPKEQL